MESKTTNYNYTTILGQIYYTFLYRIKDYALFMIYLSS